MTLKPNQTKPTNNRPNWLRLSRAKKLVPLAAYVTAVLMATSSRIVAQSAPPTCIPPPGAEYLIPQTYVLATSGLDICSLFQWSYQYTRDEWVTPWQNGTTIWCSGWIFDECEGSGNTGNLPACPSGTCVPDSSSGPG